MTRNARRWVRWTPRGQRKISQTDHRKKGKCLARQEKPQSISCRKCTAAEGDGLMQKGKYQELVSRMPRRCRASCDRTHVCSNSEILLFRMSSSAGSQTRLDENTRPSVIYCTGGQSLCIWDVAVMCKECGEVCVGVAHHTKGEYTDTKLSTLYWYHESGCHSTHCRTELRRNSMFCTEFVAPGIHAYNKRIGV